MRVSPIPIKKAWSAWMTSPFFSSNGGHAPRRRCRAPIFEFEFYADELVTAFEKNKARGSEEPLSFDFAASLDPVCAC